MNTVNSTTVRVFGGQYREDHVLYDGAVVFLKTIGSDDKGSLLDAFERLSPESRFLRFFAAKPSPSRLGAGAQMELPKASGSPGSCAVPRTTTRRSWQSLSWMTGRAAASDESSSPAWSRQRKSGGSSVWLALLWPRMTQ